MNSKAGQIICLYLNSISVNVNVGIQYNFFWVFNPFLVFNPFFFNPFFFNPFFCFQSIFLFFQSILDPRNNYNSQTNKLRQSWLLCRWILRSRRLWKSKHFYWLHRIEVLTSKQVQRTLFASEIFFWFFLLFWGMLKRGQSCAELRGTLARAFRVSNYITLWT